MSCEEQRTYHLCSFLSKCFKAYEYFQPIEYWCNFIIVLFRLCSLAIKYVPIFLSSVVQPGRARCEAEHCVERSLHREQGSLNQFRGHLAILSHFANVTELQHGIDVEGVLVQ